MLRRALLILIPAVLMSGQTGPDPVSTAKRVLDLLLSEKYDELHFMFTPEMLKALPAATLKTAGAQVRGLGAIETMGEPQRKDVQGNAVVMLPVKFASAAINVIVSVDPAGKVAGLFFQQAPSTPPPAAWQRPPYVKPEAFTEREVMVGTEPWKLPGTLSVPVGKGPFPAVILVHGSGPNDRDETVGANKPFRDLAEGLASRGVAVLRYEKRTRHYQRQMAALTGLTVQEETVEDALVAAALLRSLPEVDAKRVYVAGHSLGAMLAPRIGQQDPKLAGLIIMAGNVRPLEDLMVEQVGYLSPNNQPGMKEQAEKVKALSPSDKGVTILGVPGSYWLDLKGYNPASLAAKLDMPMLILQGERDYQVTMQDFNLWKSALNGRKGVTFRSYPALNHLFIAGEGKSLPAEYDKPGHVAAEVIEEIANFVTRRN